MVVGLLLALVVFGVIYAVMKNAGMGDRTYWNKYAETVKKIRGTESMNADQIWTYVHELPVQDVREPKLKELHETIVDWATVMRDPDEYTKRGLEVEARWAQLEEEAALKLGVPIIRK